MSKRERGDDQEEPESGKRERLVQAAAGPTLSEQDLTPTALEEDEEHEERGGEHQKLGAEEEDDHLSDDDEEDARDEEDYSEVDDYETYSGDEESWPYSTHSHLYLFSFFRGPFQAPTPPSLLRIADLRPGYHGRWETSGRVVYKSPVLSYNNQNGTGTYFRMEIADEHGGEIRVVCFNDAVDRFFKELVEGKRYLLGNGRLRAPNEMFNREQRRCEIILQHGSIVRAIQDEAKANEPQTLAQEDDLKMKVAELEKHLEVAHRGLAVANKSLEAANKNLELTCLQLQGYEAKIAHLKAMVR